MTTVFVGYVAPCREWRMLAAALRPMLKNACSHPGNEPLGVQGAGPCGSAVALWVAFAQQGLSHGDPAWLSPLLR